MNRHGGRVTRTAAASEGVRVEMETWINLVPLEGVIGLVFALLLYVSITRSSAGTKLMQEIGEAIQSGAMAFLRREYSILFAFVIVVVVTCTLGTVMTLLADPIDDSTASASSVVPGPGAGDH